jgi:hypothetical protein
LVSNRNKAFPYVFNGSLDPWKETKLGNYLFTTTYHQWLCTRRKGDEALFFIPSSLSPLS